MVVRYDGRKHYQLYGRKGKTLLQYDKTINFLVKRFKVVAKCCLNWIDFFHVDLCYCVRYSSIA